MIRAVVRKPLLPLLVLAASLPACAMQMAGGKGRVLDTTTQQPIEGASVEMECKRQLYHRSVTVRHVTVVSNRAGEYEFSFLDVAGCDFAYVHARKAGYEESDSIHSGYGYTRYAQIPAVRYLTAQADVVMLRLSAITPPRTGIAFRTDGSPAHASEYRIWYDAFFQAKDIAQTDRERRFVRERYCETLPKLHAAMNGEERAALANASVSYHWRGASKAGRHDYEGEVLRYCAR